MEYANKYKEILLKVPEHISNFLQVHKFVMGLKEMLRPLVKKEICKTLNEEIELALVLEDGKSQRIPWTRGALPTFTPAFASSEPCIKETREVYMIKMVSGNKCKVSAMVEREPINDLFLLQSKGRKLCAKAYVMGAWVSTSSNLVPRKHESARRCKCKKWSK